MAWTTPPTFVAGTVLTASQLNTYIRDNTNYLLNGKFVKELYYLKGSDYTLTTPQATWTAIDSVNMLATTPTSFSSGRVRVDIHFWTLPGASVSKILLDVSVDSKTYSGSGTVNANGTPTATPMTNGLTVSSNDVGYSGSSVPVQIHMSFIINGLTTGVAHTFEPMYQTTGSGTNKILATYHPYYIVVEEI